MNQLFRMRINRSLLKEVERLTAEVGTTPEDVVRQLFKQLVKSRAIPWPLTTDAQLDELLNSRRRNRVLANLDGCEGW
jgi:antitoxin component of RelBE/YafQ-DinJ toxin-antitoxin module